MIMFLEPIMTLEEGFKKSGYPIKNKQCFIYWHNFKWRFYNPNAKFQEENYVFEDNKGWILEEKQPGSKVIVGKIMLNNIPIFDVWDYLPHAIVDTLNQREFNSNTFNFISKVIR